MASPEQACNGAALDQAAARLQTAPTMVASTLHAEQAILTLVAERGPSKSICPSEAARLVGGENWHAELTLIRRVAIQLAAAGKIEILRKGKPVADAADVKGVIRLRLATGQ